jgi:CHAT domain-containing protein/tetratricopeptide (TPR) repeat protein
MTNIIQSEVESLHEQVGQLYQQGQYEQAIKAAERLVKLARRHLGKDSADYASCLNDLALLYNKSGREAEAERLYRQALTIYRATLSQDDPSLATLLSNLALLLYNWQDYAAAEPLFREALQIWRAGGDEFKTEIVFPLNNLAALLQNRGRYAEAEELYREALAILRETVGEEHADVATLLKNLALALKVAGKYAAASEAAQQALELRRRIFGARHPEVAGALRVFAELDHKAGRYAEAEANFQQALNILSETVGEQSEDFADCLSSLSSLYETTGRHAEAEALDRRAAEIYRAALGEDSLQFATSLNNLAVTRKELGDYGEAEALHRRSLAIKRRILGDEHPKIADGLNNLAELKREMGDYATAETLHQAALEMRRRWLGEEHPDVAQSLNNLGLLRYAQDDYQAAEEMFRQAAEVLRRALGDAHPALAVYLNNLAAIKRLLGEYAAAEPLIRESLEVYRAAFGERHPYYAAMLSNLAELYRGLGENARAEPLCEQALEIWRAALGEDHPYCAKGLYNLAWLRAAQGQTQEAFALACRAASIEDRALNQVFAISSESQRMAHLATLRANFEVFLSLVREHFAPAGAEVCAALDLTLRRKAIGAEALAVQRDAALSGRRPELASRLQALAALRAQIARKLLEGPGGEEGAAYRRQLADWEAQREELEAELARQIPEIGLIRRLQTAGRREVSNALPKRSALIEFVRADTFDFNAAPARDEARWKPGRYLAFVLPAGSPADARLIDLGPAEPIEAMIAAFRSAITGEAETKRGAASTPVRHGHAGQAPARPTAGGDGRALREMVFDPLRSAIGKRTRLLIAPDGDLTRLPFEALPLDDGRRLIDWYHISYLSVGRDALRFKAASSRPPADPLVVADPDFDLVARAGGAAAKSAPERGRQARGLDLSALRFDRLPGTRKEGRALAARLQTRPMMGRAALEGRLKACRSPRILHIATHGFFLPDEARERLPETLGLEIGPAAPGLAGQPLTNPLLRSGLALAGANAGVKRGALPPQAEDGLLTAEDVTGLDLLATDLVVLSACETGLGDVRAGEGVFGLRRAFMLAGAKTLVMSLWKVPDRHTQELMTDFYQRILGGRPRAAALREAQLAMKAKYPDPFYWGAFICQGTPGALPGSVARRGRRKAKNTKKGNAAQWPEGNQTK